MVAYRFCRSSDIPLLTRAANICYDPHFFDRPPMREEDFKREMREIDLWPSSCMVALDDREPIGVLLACKRATESLIYRIGVRADHQRQGHGRHLLESLSQKLSVLGPPRLVAEVPEQDARACDFFEACGYAREREYCDYVLTRGDSGKDRVLPTRTISAEEAVGLSMYDREMPRCWERAAATVLGRKERLVGTLVRLEDGTGGAFALTRSGRSKDITEIVAFGHEPENASLNLLRAIFRCFADTSPKGIVIPKLKPDEFPRDALESWGFEPGEKTIGFAAQARGVSERA